MSGPAPKPTVLKKLAGNPGKRKLNDAEPQITPALPKCPMFLKGEARREWKRIARELAQVGLLTNVDRSALAAYCQAWGRWVDTERQLEGEDLVIISEKGGAYQNPLLSIANKAMDQMLKAAAEFGMTPSSRSRIKVEKPEQIDPFEEFVKQRLGD